MNSKIKYILCISVSLITVCAITAFPQLYYSASDKKPNKNYSFESIPVEEISADISCEQVRRMITSDKSVWISEDREPITSDVLDLITTAVNRMKKSMSQTELNSQFADAYLDSKENNLIKCSFLTASGIIDELPVSTPLLYAELSGSSFSYMSILIDRKTNIVYQYYIISKYFTDTDEQLRKDTENAFCKYWGIEENNPPIVMLGDNFFSVYLFDYNYYDLLYNSQDDDSNIFTGNGLVGG